jgi:hypothetical protein
VGSLGAALGWVLTRQQAVPSFSIETASQNAAASALGSASERTGAGSAGYPFAAWRYEIQEIPDVALHDANRNVDIHVSLLFPKNRGKFPVIIFSPDDRESSTCCQPLIEDWASHGYAVVQLTRAAIVHAEKHADSVQTIRFKRAIPKHATASQAAARTLDVTFVIDSLAALQTRFPEIRGKLDAAHIGVAGHASGAVAVEAIAGAVLELPGQPRANLADPRVRAVICISPQGPGRAGLTEQSFDQLILPYFGVTADGDAAPAKYAPAGWHKAPFERSQPGEKYELFIRGEDLSVMRENPVAQVAAHDEAGPKRPTARHIHGATLAFWDAYLKHEMAAKAYLQSGALQKAGGGEVTLDRR